MKYRAEINGLRAVAVIPVILFHAGFEQFSGGYVGVDVFFVISGYLITTLLIDDLDRGQFSLLRFYERRARRILPALFCVLLACLPFAWLWMLPSQMKEFAQALVAVCVFASNILFWQKTDYFAPDSEENPLLHTWSLAVEEQYYLFFPLLLLALAPFSRRFTVAIISALALGSLLLAEWTWRHDAAMNFYLIPTRAWELFAGSLAAFIIYKQGIKTNNLMASAGLIAIITSVFIFDADTPFPSLYALLPVVGTMGIIIYAAPQTLVAKLLSTNTLVGIGLISYSAYLWHQPLFAFARIKLVAPPPPQLMAALAALTLLLAALSWKYVEQPFRRTSLNNRARNRVLITAMVALGGIACIGVLGHWQQGFSQRFSAKLSGDFGQMQFHQYIDDKYLDCEPKRFAQRALTFKHFLRCKQTHHGEVDWVLLGDSHAEHLFLGLAEQHPERNISFYIFGAPPYLNAPEFSHVYEALATSTKPKRVFLTMHYLTRSESPSQLHEEFGAIIERLQAQQHEVILIGDIPRFQITGEACAYAPSAAYIANHCKMPRATFDLQKTSFESTLTALAHDYDVPYIAIHGALCDSNDCQMTLADTLLYRDTNHLNIPGSQRVGKYLSQRLPRAIVGQK